MRRIHPVVLALIVWFGFSAFSHPNGIFRIDPPGNWRVVKQDEDSVLFAPGGDETRGSMYVSAIGPVDKAPPLTEIFDAVKSDNESVVQKRNYAIGGQDGLYLETRSANARGVQISTRWALCYVPNKAGGAPTTVFFIWLKSPTALLGENEPAFSQAVRSLRWGR